MMGKAIGVVVFLVILLPLSAQDITFGSPVESMFLKDCFGTDLTVPFGGIVTLLFYFDASNPIQVNNLLQLEFLSHNINNPLEVFRVAAISKSPAQALQSLSHKFGLHCRLLSGTKEALHLAQESCGSCERIILVDKTSRVRYVSSQFDPTFIREIIQRYGRDR